MTRKRLVLSALIALVLLGAAGFLLFLKSPPEQKLKTFTIGVINPNPGSSGMHEVFISELQKYAAREGWQLTFTLCDKKESFDADLEALVSQGPDLLLTITTPGTEKAQKAFAGKNVPGVFVLFDPVEAGIIKELAHPGGNFTGIRLRGSVPKALEWLLDIAPEIKNIFVPVKFDTESAQMSLDDLKKAAEYLGVQLHVAEMDTKKELVAALDSIPEETDAIFLVNSILISTNAQTIVQAAIDKKLPTAASIGKDQEGVLLTYSSQHALLGKQASRLAYLILNGQNPAEIPAEISDFQLIVNLTTAEKIGLKIPDSILAQADRILRQQQ